MEELTTDPSRATEEIDGYELNGVVVAVHDLAAGDPEGVEVLLQLIEAGYIELVLGEERDLPRSA